MKSPSKRLEEARKAFNKGDEGGSAQAHNLDNIHRNSEMHGGAGSKYLGEMVYGGLDGIITTFSIVSGVAGAQLGTPVVLILGVANLLADGFSMATGAYLSTKSEQEYYRRELERESWEVEHYPEGEKAELIEIYRRRGYADEEAHQLVEIYSRKPQRWVKAMMVDELGMLEDETNPLINGLVTFGAFVAAGVVPLLIYLLGLVLPIPSEINFPISIGLSALALFGLGALKVRVTQLNLFRSGLEMLVVGGLAATVAYIVGALLKGIGA